MPADALVLGTFIVAPILSLGWNADSAPPQNYFAATAQVERLYKENGRVIATAVMDPAAAQSACPNGSQVARQTSRVDGTREYLVWTLRCR
ncbi:MAG TPA: hypothetical protein VHM01_12880 [Alphaproteobacteria bacterium]|nr:hypothetical protein [Alphaproteobacteria bacterium]